MKRIALDEKWTFRRGFIDSLGGLEADPGVEVNLPHDGMISLEVTENAQAKFDSGYFPGDTCNYTKYVMIPKEWENECIGLNFDGSMMHTTIEINGCKVGEHHYGYSPFYVDITDYVTFGVENRVTINVNTGIQPSSRWYTGSGLFRGLTLCHSPRVHVANDGIYLFTKEIEDNRAYIAAQIEIGNSTLENRLVEVTVSLAENETKEVAAKTTQLIQVNPGKQEVAKMTLILENSKLWDCENPNLYQVTVVAADMGVYRTHFVKNDNIIRDEATALFGVRTITADAVRGLRINGKTVKLKGGCLHHDNGLLGAVSLYEAEARKIKKLKEIGFNAIRTTHNPPSLALVEACDRIGMYIFDEAFDAWGMAKRAGDYSNYFTTCWEQDLSAFIKRDRIHPAVIIWSIGNEIPERGGLGNGYTLASRLAEKVKELDATRPVSNGICSFWSGLDDFLAKGTAQYQNAFDGTDKDVWERGTEAYTNGLDIVGYNYMEDLYVRDHELYPERVILGSENFPKEIGFHWPMVEELPYVIGEFTWTAWDYIGEAGIGKAIYVDKNDPMAEKKPWEIMPPQTSYFPWRLANDADVDITGRILPQGAYRSVVWGNEKTYLFSQHPDHFGKVELMSMWGFPAVSKNWNYEEYENKSIELLVFSNADEVELLMNGQVIERKKVSTKRPMPNSVRFNTTYHSGKVEAVSYRDGKEVSRDAITTTGKPASIRLVPEKNRLNANGHDLIYVGIDILDHEGYVVPDASVELTAEVTGCGVLAGFGTGNPITDEDYTAPRTISYRGHAMAILRSSYKQGATVLRISAKDFEPAEITIE